jgi:hypothetical protein
MGFPDFTIRFFTAESQNQIPGFFYDGRDRMATDADFSHEANEENEEDSSPSWLPAPRSPLSALPSPLYAPHVGLSLPAPRFALCKRAWLRRQVRNMWLCGTALSQTPFRALAPMMRLYSFRDFDEPVVT